ncbi:NAD(P)/FAD-dependent oxidoreductase [Aliiroseovarius sp. YM-037]|uniref:NAD(P)/FAD-dependent oxidoreductase n=1 Tax=Aliiroseovarius sp. YM-037 TaxID=3341728 RepID=UPI003A7FB35B
MADGQQIVVIGAGIVGMSTAIWLRRAGKDVTVIDRGEPGQGTSFGNGGVLASAAVVPVTTPGLAVKGPKLLFDPNFPLFLRWSYLPRLAPWLIKYLAHANDADTRRISKGLELIVGDSVEQHKALVKGTSAERWVTESDYVFAYRDQAAFDADSYTWGLRREAGFVPEMIQGGAVQEYDPAFGPETGLLAVMKNHGHIRSPGKYVMALADVLRAEGGTVRQATLEDVDLKDGRIVAVVTDQGRIACDGAVLATGVWSKPLAKKLGLKVPLESERGYHIVLKSPSKMLRSPAMIAAGKFVATPMEDGMRCAGVVEFGGLDAPASKAPLAFLRRMIKQTFPDMTWEDEEEWLGHRPATTDSLPLIGEINGTGVFSGFGHQHIGLTGGPKTGRLIADLMSNKGTNLDLSAFDPARFA